MSIIAENTDAHEALTWQEWGARVAESYRVEDVALRSMPEFQEWAASQPAPWNEDDCARVWMRHNWHVLEVPRAFWPEWAVRVEVESMYPDATVEFFSAELVESFAVRQTFTVSLTSDDDWKEQPPAGAVEEGALIVYPIWPSDAVESSVELRSIASALMGAAAVLDDASEGRSEVRVAARKRAEAMIRPLGTGVSLSLSDGADTTLTIPLGPVEAQCMVERLTELLAALDD